MPGETQAVLRPPSLRHCDHCGEYAPDPLHDDTSSYTILDLPVRIDPSLSEGTFQLVDSKTGEVRFEGKLPKADPVTQVIGTWDEWPADVVDVLRSWNRRHLLSFVRHGLFVCSVCHREVEAHENGNAHLRTRRDLIGKPLCETCLIHAGRFAMYGCLPSVE